MKFINEDLRKISVEGQEFLKTNPEFESLVKSFEAEFDVADTLKASARLIEFATENVYLKDIEEDTDDGYMTCDSWSKPHIQTIKYYADGDKLMLSVEVIWTGYATEYSDYVPATYWEPGYYNHEYDTEIYAYTNIDITIPETVDDYDTYAFTGDADNDIEYEY